MGVTVGKATRQAAGQIAPKIPRHLTMKVTSRRRAPPRCVAVSGNGRFPYIRTTGRPAKIIASASGCTASGLKVILRGAGNSPAGPSYQR